MIANEIQWHDKAENRDKRGLRLWSKCGHYSIYKSPSQFHKKEFDYCATFHPIVGASVGVVAAGSLSFSNTKEGAMALCQNHKDGDK